MYNRISFTGDIMCSASQIEAYKVYENYNEIFEELYSYFSESDYVVGNIETPVAGESCSGYTDQKIKWQFNSPLQFAKAVYDSGITIATTANNHCLNRGVEGLDKTLLNLRKLGFQTIGTNLSEEEKRYIILQLDTVKVAIHSYTYGTNAFDDLVYLKKSEKYKVNLLQEQELHNKITRKIYLSKSIPFRILKKINNKVHPNNSVIYERREKNKKQLQQLKKDIIQSKEEGADVVIACLHIGGQYNSEPTEYARELVEKTFSFGADVIIGNHEHVIHKVELREKKFVAYSLGNFTSDAGVNREPFKYNAEYSIIINVYISKEKELKYTFSICKSIPLDEKRIKTVLLYDCIKQEKDKCKREKLINDNNCIVKKILGENEDCNDVKLEYCIN